MAYLSLNEAAAALRISRRTLEKKSFRAKIGLIGIKVGSRVLFDEGEIETFKLSHREVLERTEDDGNT